MPDFSVSAFQHLLIKPNPNIFREYDIRGVVEKEGTWLSELSRIPSSWAPSSGQSRGESSPAKGIPTVNKIRFVLVPLCLSGLVILFSGCTIVGAMVGAKCDRNHARGYSRRMAEAQSCDSAVFHNPVEVAYREYETDYNAARAKLDSVSLPSLGETVVVSNEAGLSQRAVFSGFRSDSALFGFNPIRPTALTRIYQMTDTSGLPYALSGVGSLVRNRMIPERDPLLDRALGMYGARQALAMGKPARETKYWLVGMGIGLLVDGIIVAAIAKDPDGFVARLIPAGGID